MKYDEQVFRLSVEALNEVELSSNIDEETKKKQDKLLKILLEKFEEKLKSKEDIKEGILKVRIESPFWQKNDLGYSEIEELLKSNNFDSFARDYCIYLGDVEYRCDEDNTAYYEIIWDYRTYYEQLKTVEGSKVVSEIDELRLQAKKDFCKINGHDFEEWKQIKWTTQEELGKEALFTDVATRKIEHIMWRRKCQNCGYEQNTTKKPKEVKASEIKIKIKALQQQLKEIEK